MTTRPAYVRISLLDRFKGLRRSSLSPADAARLLDKQYYADHFQTEINLPNGTDFVWDEPDGLRVNLPDGRRLDPAKIMTRPPGPLDPFPRPFSQIAALKSNESALAAATIGDACPHAAPPPPAPEPPPASKPPWWILTVDLQIDAEIERNDQFPTLGSARDTVMGLLKTQKKAVPRDRTIERGIRRYRPYWIKE